MWPDPQPKAGVRAGHAGTCLQQKGPNSVFLCSPSGSKPSVGQCSPSPKYLLVPERQHGPHRAHTRHEHEHTHAAAHARAPAHTHAAHTAEKRQLLLLGWATVMTHHSPRDTICAVRAGKPWGRRRKTQPGPGLASVLHLHTHTEKTNGRRARAGAWGIPCDCYKVSEPSPNSCWTYAEST